MVTVIRSGSDMFNYTANPQTRAILNNYCANSMNQFLVHHQVNPYQQGTQLYQMIENIKQSAISGIEHSNTPEAVIAKTQSMLNYMALNNREAFDQIYQIQSNADISTINPTIQQYVMSDLSLAEAYDKGMIDGYSTTYALDAIQKDLPLDKRYSHIDRMNGVLQFDDEGQGFTVETIYFDTLETEKDRLKLSLSDKMEIDSLVSQIKRARASGIDLTKQ